MPIFDRYPLVDGTFFLSPRAYSKSALPVNWPAASNNTAANIHSIATSPLSLLGSPLKEDLKSSPRNVEFSSRKPLFLHLNAVCMGCLEGWNLPLKCRGCKVRWSGKHLVLGSMYTYDIFAAMPCCRERLRCERCKSLVIRPEQRLQFFSDYSHAMACASCGLEDFHFVKQLSNVFTTPAAE